MHLHRNDAQDLSCAIMAQTGQRGGTTSCGCILGGTLPPKTATL